MKKSIFKAVAIVTVFSVLTRTLSFVFKMYLSRTAGAEVMGLYQICLSLFFMFSALSSSGLTTVLSRKTAESKALDPNEKAHSYLSSTLVISVSVAVVTVLTLFVFKPYLSKLLSDERAVPLFIIMLPALISSCIYYTIRSWFWGSKQFTYFSVTETVEEVLRILFTLLFVSGLISGISGAYGIALAFTVSDMVVAVILIIMYFAKGGRLVRPTRIKEILKPAVPLTAMRVFGSLIGTLLALMLPARLILSGLSISEATAYFGRVSGMAAPLLFAPNAIISSLAVVLIPEMSESGIKKDKEKLSKQINTGITFALLVSGLFLVVYASVGKELTELLFKDTISGEYLQAAAWLLLLMPIHQLTTSALNSIGMEKEAFYSYLSSTAFMIASIYLLTPKIGILSVVVGNFITLIISTGGNLYFLNKHMDMKLNFIKPFVLITIFTFPTILLITSINSLLTNYSMFLGIFAGAGAGCVMYTVLVSIFGLVDFGGFIKLRKIKAAKPF